MGRCIVLNEIRLLLLIRPFRVLDGWNLVHTWTMGGCIMYMYTGIGRLLHICPFIFSFFFRSNFQTLKCFCHTFLRICDIFHRLWLWFITFFSRNARHKKLKQYKVTNIENKYNVLCILKSGCSYFFIPFFLPLSVSPIFSLYQFIFLLR